MNRDDTMTSSAQPTALALEALKDGKLAGSWTLDPERSEIRLRTGMFWGLHPIKGAFREVSGGGTITPSGEVGGTMTIAAGSIDTRSRRRDRHLRSSFFLDADKHPEIVYTVDRVEPHGEGVTLAGGLTVHGRTRPMSVEAEVAGLADGELRLDGRARVDRAEFGLTWSPLGVALTKNTITFQVVFTRRDPSAASG